MILFNIKQLPHRGESNSFSFVDNCLSSWPSKILLDKFIEYFVVRSIKLLQSLVRTGFNFGLWSSFRFVETFISGASPLTLRQGQLLPSAVETLGGVKEEIVLSYLIRNPQEGFHLSQTYPRLLDEFVPINNLYLFQRKISHPPSITVMNERLVW